MEFGKLDDISGIDFRLPPDPPENARFFKNLPEKLAAPHLFLGATGWAMKEWVGNFYPERARPADFLRHYGLQFNTIEANTTHYRIPDAATILYWKNETPADFRFCPKVPQSISHRPDLGLNGPDLPLFCEALFRLEEKVGIVFIQLPPYFGPRDLPKLELFLKKWPTQLPLAVEVRQEDFFKGNDGEKLFQLLENQQVATCMTDVAGRRDVLHLRLTAPSVVIRFISNGGHPTDFERADEWAARLANWFENGLREAWFFAHAPDNLRSPELAMMLDEKFRRAMPEIPMRGPFLLKKEAVQGSLF